MYLVTGGAGFIGSNIARKLLERGEQVRLLDDFSTGKRENLRDLEGAEIIEGSLLDQACLQKALEGVAYILHQAAISSVPRSVKDPLSTNEANVTGTLNLLESAKQAKVKRFVNASSCAVYGNTEDLPVTERAGIDPLSPYAVSKYTGELYAKVFAHVYGLPTISLRYFNIFGPYQDPASEYAAVIPRFILRMLEGKEPVIYGDGEQSRDFTYIDNAVEANLLACTSNQVGSGEVINVACGENYSLNRLVELLNKIMGTKYKPVYSDPRPGDVRHSLADITKAQDLLGYKSKVSFKEGLKRTVEWFSSR